ncbi:MAG: hypothetical protein PHP08_00375 [Candidatus Dojkabacteria bacterium]|nr:hypothetical protein [Candidatus Dojkabacteria bacterium]
MADIERSALYVGVGLFAGLYLMSRFSAFRPVSSSMSLQNSSNDTEDVENPYGFHIPGIDERKPGDPDYWIGEPPS